MFRVVLAVFLMGYAMIALGNHCAGPDVITDPPAFQWTFNPASGNTEAHYSGTLEMGEATFTINGETLTTRAYRQEGSAYSIPGPSLHMTPGNKYVLKFKNTLPYELLSTATNTFKDPNVTNLHTHGLHISGETPSDDVTRFFEGGFGGDFVYDIPADHMGGSYWYHAHHHGSTFLQVSSGAFGNIIIDDSLDGLPANVANMEEKELIIAFLDPGAAGTGGDTLISGTLSPTWTVNGKVAGTGTTCMPPNTWQHWRVLLADRNASPKTITVGDQCEIALMARDGVWRTEVPLNLSPSNSITITGASRADLAVRCSADTNISVDNTVVANIAVEGIADATVHPYNTDGVSTWSANRPAYLRDLRALTPDNFETVSMGARTINGAKFDHTVPTFTLPATDLQEWTVKGAQQHPFHLHVYHMQMTSDCGDYEGGEYYDTIATNCDVRFDLNAATSDVYSGRTIMHCHILAHEDQGAMGWADIVGGQAPPVYPQGVGYQAYYSLGDTGGGTPPLTPSSLVATAVSSSQIDLSWVDNASDEDGFEIERSTDGVNFAIVASVASNVTGYGDSNGLAASTTYNYRVRATNANGSSDYSNVAGATTGPEVAGTTMVVNSVTVTTVSEARGQKRGRAVVVVTDNIGTPVEGAVVLGAFSGTFNETVLDSTPTGATGSTTIDTSGTTKGGISLTFCVEAINTPAGNTLEAYTGPQVCGSL